MKNKLPKLFIVVLLLILSVGNVEARRGCCSWHGGVAGCDRDAGRLVCRDGQYSPSCGCEKRNPFIMIDGKSTLPEGAILNYQKDGWICKKGYKQVGNSCQKINIPQNASLSYDGHNWQCNNRFKKVWNENRCEREEKQ